MHFSKNLPVSLFAAVVIAFAPASLVLAEKPEWAGQGKGDKHEQKEKYKEDTHKEKNTNTTMMFRQ